MDPVADSAGLVTLLQLARHARHASESSELRFVLVNQSFQLAQYRQAALWTRNGGIEALSGVSAPEQNAPFVQWLDRLARALAERTMQEPAMLTASDAPANLRESWAEWLPGHLLWLPFGATAEAAGGLLLAREEAWQKHESALLAEWVDTWAHAWGRWQRASAGRSLARTLGSVLDPSMWRRAPAVLLSALAPGRLRQTLLNLWRVRARRYAVLAGLVLFIPVRLTVLAPGELVPATPALARAPFDGVVERVWVQPNQHVKVDDPLFTLDRTTLQARLDVAEQALLTAQAEYRQQAQIAVFDPKGKARLADLEGAAAERQADAAYLRQQLGRSTVTAARDGIVLFDDPSGWTGRPVVAGERLATVANEHEVEIEAWLAPGDLIDLPPSAPITLYLNTAPLSPVKATLRYVQYEAMQRPDGQFAYRLRGSLSEDKSVQRVGLKGTVKVSGERVPLVYWMLRRPLATSRQFLGL
jgi:hypothetical protein